MPIYEYRCKNCGKEFEMMQKFSDEPLTECIECSGSVEKLISQSAFVLKGSGWYKTDYGTDSSSKSTDSAAKSGGEEKSSPCSGCPAADAKND